MNLKKIFGMGYYGFIFVYFTFEFISLLVIKNSAPRTYERQNFLFFLEDQKFLYIIGLIILPLVALVGLVGLVNVFKDEDSNLSKTIGTSLTAISGIVLFAFSMFEIVYSVVENDEPAGLYVGFLISIIVYVSTSFLALLLPSGLKKVTNLQPQVAAILKEKVSKSERILTCFSLFLLLPITYLFFLVLSNGKLMVNALTLVSMCGPIAIALFGIAFYEADHILGR